VISATLGLRASRGGAVVVAVAFEDAEPRIVLSSFVSTAEEHDRLAAEPYHVAAELAREPNETSLAEAEAAVREGRKRQDKLAATGLRGIVERLRSAGFDPTGSALLVNRAGWVTDLLRYSLASSEHPAVAEGLAVREAVRYGLRKVEIPFEELDEKTLAAEAASSLHLTSPKLEAHLKDFGTTAGRPWRKEHKLACLAAWVTCAKADAR
jgi:hypothetical protein